MQLRTSLLPTTPVSHTADTALSGRVQGVSQSDACRKPPRLYPGSNSLETSGCINGNTLPKGSAPCDVKRSEDAKTTKKPHMSHKQRSDRVFADAGVPHRSGHSNEPFPHGSGIARLRGPRPSPASPVPGASSRVDARSKAPAPGSPGLYKLQGQMAFKRPSSTPMDPTALTPSCHRPHRTIAALPPSHHPSRTCPDSFPPLVEQPTKRKPRLPLILNCMWRRGNLTCAHTPVYGTPGTHSCTPPNVPHERQRRVTPSTVVTPQALC